MWVDGQPAWEGQSNKRWDNSSLQCAHWGMYAGGPVDHGIQYNDEIRIWTLENPLPISLREPRDPLGSAVNWQKWANKNMSKTLNTLGNY